MTRRNIIVVAAAIAVLLLAWYLLLWSPTSADLSAAKERRVAAETEAAQLEQRLQTLRLAAEDLPALTATYERVTSAVPEEPDLAEFLLAANDAAKRAGVDYLSVSPQPPALEAGPSKIGVAISVGARYDQLLAFMEELLAMPRILVVDSIQVAPGEPGALAVSLTGRTFTTWVPSALAGPGAPAPAAPATSPTTVPAPAPADDEVAGPAPEVTSR